MRLRNPSLHDDFPNRMIICFSFQKTKFCTVFSSPTKNVRRLATVFLALECIFWNQIFAQKIINFDFLDTTPPFHVWPKFIFYWFPSNSCHHSNSNGQRLILNNVEYLENWSETLWRNLNYVNYSTYTQLVCEVREKSVRAFSSKSWFIFFTGWFWSFLQFSPIFQERWNLKLSLFSWKIFCDSKTFLMYIELPRWLQF